MNSETVAVISRSVLSFLLIAGGIYALWIGLKLYTSGTGLSPDGSTIEFNKFKAGLKNTGSAVMLTAAAWGGLGYLASPDFESTEHGAKITKTDAPQPGPVSAEFPQLKIVPTSGHAVQITSAADLEKELGQKFGSSPSKWTINGKTYTIENITDFKGSPESFTATLNLDEEWGKGQVVVEGLKDERGAVDLTAEGFGFVGGREG